MPEIVAPSSSIGSVKVAATEALTLQDQSRSRFTNVPQRGHSGFTQCDFILKQLAGTDACNCLQQLAARDDIRNGEGRYKRENNQEALTKRGPYHGCPRFPAFPSNKLHKLSTLHESAALPQPAPTCPAWMSIGSSMTRSTSGACRLAPPTAILISGRMP